jgi:hypothetical protein
LNSSFDHRRDDEKGNYQTVFALKKMHLPLLQEVGIIRAMGGIYEKEKMDSDFLLHIPSKDQV